MQEFVPCSEEFINNICHGSCCESHTGKRKTMITIHPTEVENIKLLGGQVKQGMLDHGGNKCPFKENDLCTLHGTDNKPFGCVVSPFTLNKNGTLIVRNRYRMLKCFRTKDGKIPAYIAHRYSLKAILGEEETVRVINTMISTKKDVEANMPDNKYRIIRENDEAKEALSNP